MAKKAQMVWAAVGRGGYINWGYMSFTRRGVIEKIFAEYADLRSSGRWGVGLTDAQFWRKMKRGRGWSIKRISLRVAR